MENTTIRKEPIIGTIVTRSMWFGGYEYPSTTYDVIEVCGDIYITNQWYKHEVPQVVHSDMVQEYIEK